MPLVVYTANFIAQNTEDEDRYDIYRICKRELVGTFFNGKYTSAPNTSLTYGDYEEISSLMRVCTEGTVGIRLLQKTKDCYEVYYYNNVLLGEYIRIEDGSWMFSPQRGNGGGWPRHLLEQLVLTLGVLDNEL